VRAVLVDTGPVVALLDGSDPDHQRCVRALQAFRDPLVTVWPVVTEAMYLLGRISWGAQDALWEMLDTQLRLLPLVEVDMTRMRALMKKYRDRPMDLADAALVAVAERHQIKQVFTLDQTDFSLYRPARIGRFSVIP